MDFRNPIFIHYVHDMRRALGFYQRAFGVKTSTESSGWSTLDFGTVELALHILAPGSQSEGPIPHAGFNLEVDRIEDAQALVEAAGGSLLQLREAEPHIPVRVASFVDTEGNGFELRQNMVDV